MGKYGPAVKLLELVVGSSETPDRVRASLSKTWEACAERLKELQELKRQEEELRKKEAEQLVAEKAAIEKSAAAEDAAAREAERVVAEK
eukprot:COSAG06_NODE_9408_length_1909_cov_1.311602_1_plen_88_part_10